MRMDVMTTAHNKKVVLATIFYFGLAKQLNRANSRKKKILHTHITYAIYVAQAWMLSRADKTLSGIFEKKFI